MSTEFWIALGSIATASIVLINFYLVIAKPWWGKPRLVIDYRDGEPYCRHTTANRVDPEDRHAFLDPVADTYWIRVRVANEGRSLARRCLGKLAVVFDGNGTEIENFDPMQLNWAGAHWGVCPLETIDLGRGEYEYLAVLLTQEDNDYIYFAGDQLPCTPCEKRGITVKLRPGVYVLKVTVYGDDVDPQSRYLGLVWGGQSTEDVAVRLHGRLGEAQRWLAKEKRQCRGS